VRRKNRSWRDEEKHIIAEGKELSWGTSGLKLRGTNADLAESK